MLLLLALCEENPPIHHWWFPSQRPVMQSFDVFFDLHLNKWLSKQLGGQSFEMPLHSLWCHCNALTQRQTSPQVLRILHLYSHLLLSIWVKDITKKYDIDTWKTLFACIMNEWYILSLLMCVFLCHQINRNGTHNISIMVDQIIGNLIVCSTICSV